MMWALQSISYAVAVKSVKGLNVAPKESMVGDWASLKAAGVVVQQQDPDMLKFKKVGFVAIIAMVIDFYLTMQII